jgi:NAD-dependent dihydropyrimidine dehydrogenase PreA subunit
MQTSPAYRRLAEKFVFKKSWEDVIVPDSLLKIVTFLFTEEEAEIVEKLSFLGTTARAVARKMNRPVAEVEPILKSLSDRALILGLKVKGLQVYGFMGLAPGIFEAQMVVSRGEKGEYFREFARLFEEFYAEFFTWLKPRVEGKELRFGRVISIEKAIDRTPGLNVLALDTDIYSEIIDRNKSFCRVNVCACRHQADLMGKWCGKPKDVCGGMGLLADIAVEKGWARRVDKKEFLETKARAADAGLVNMVDNLADPMQMCSCCGDCCGALRILTEFNIPTIVVQSHFEAEVDQAKCKGCGTCVKFCPMNAIKVENKKAEVNLMRCIGCGVCVYKCDKNRGVSMKERPNYKPPAGGPVDFAVDRYLELKGYEGTWIPRLSLGAGRLLNQIFPKISGPGYKPRI